MKYQVSCNISDVPKIKSDELLKFTASVLEMCGIKIDDLFPKDLDSSAFGVKMKQELVQACDKFNLSIVDFVDGTQQIFAGGNLIAKWNKPFIEYREDLSKVDRNKRLYAMINFDFWSEFEEGMDHE